MINLHELRIGNLICLNRNADKPWVRIDEDEMEVLCAARSYDWYDPIPLTTELLEKCGFKNGSLNLSEEGVYLLFDKTIIIDATTWGQISLETPAKYLHQLQNLYFALTGEELNINL